MEYYASVHSFKTDILHIYGHGKMPMVLECEKAGYKNHPNFVKISSISKCRDRGRSVSASVLWILWVRYFFDVGAHLSIVGCLVASLTPTIRCQQQLPQVVPLVGTTKNHSRGNNQTSKFRWFPLIDDFLLKKKKSGVQVICSKFILHFFLHSDNLMRVFELPS